MGMSLGKVKSRREPAAAVTPSVVRWSIPEEVSASPAVEYRNMFARSLALRKESELVQSYVYLSIGQMQQMVKLAFRNLPVRPFHGIGLDLGAGCGLLSSVVAQSHRVEEIFALEVCGQMCEEVIPKVARWVLRERYSKVVPVCGTFDRIELSNDSIDFIVEIDSLHHSDNLTNTLAECARVLKSGGQMLCFDRCHPNTLSDDQVETMLSEVYSEKFLQANCYPRGIRLTRRENGEHEYRMFEWEEAFAKNGLRLVRMRQFVEDIRFAIALKGCLTFIPAPLRRRLYRSDNGDWQITARWLKARLKSLNRGGFGKAIRAPRSTSCFLLEKV
jgi:ubiquinone/menaquinone biosynthesis C-methylase UbiE